MCYGTSSVQDKQKKGGNGMLSVIAKLPIKEGKMEEIIQAFKELMVQVAKEEGTVAYTINRSQATPNTLVVMERYKDKSALDAHSSSPHFKAFLPKSGALMAGRPEITVLEEIHSI